MQTHNIRCRSVLACLIFCLFSTSGTIYWFLTLIRESTCSELAKFQANAIKDMIAYFECNTIFTMYLNLYLMYDLFFLCFRFTEKNTKARWFVKWAAFVHFVLQAETFYNRNTYTTTVWSIEKKKLPKMTVTYSLDVANTRFCGFAKLLARWKGSIYQILWKEFSIFCLAYTALSITYRCFLNPQERT